ncbi:MAG: right-handed parallel beta-helix repeat-containing protein [bacterium]
MMRAALMIVCLVVSSAVGVPWARAADYYVDNGHPAASDSNPGTEQAPWSRCPGLDGWAGTATLVPGDVVYFASGGTWEISGGESLLQVTGGVTYDGAAWGNGTRATFRATGDLHLSLINFMEDHATLPTVVRGFEVDAGGTRTTGIAVNWPANGDLVGATKRVEDCHVHDVWSESAAGEYEYGIVVSSGYGGGLTVSNVEIVDCTAHDISRGGVNIYSANDDPGSRITDVLVRGCEVWATGLDPDYAGSGIALKNHVRDVIVEYNTVRDTTRGMGIGISTQDDTFRGPERLTVRYNIVRNAAQMGVNLNVWGSLSLDLYGNLITGNLYQGIRFMRVAGDVSIRIYNNTLIHNYEPTWSHEMLVYTEGANVQLLEVTNNLFVSLADTIPLQDDDGSITDHSNNLFYRPGTDAPVVRSGGQTYTAADIATWEPSALAEDPLLEDVNALPTGFVGAYGVDLRPNAGGASPTAGSPAVDTGEALGAPYDNSINSVARPNGAGWDRGAFEYLEGSVYPDASVEPDAAAPADAGPGSDSGATDPGDGSGGCSCRSSAVSVPTPLIPLFLVGLWLRLLRRRRR